MGVEPVGLEGRARHYRDLDAALETLGATPRAVAVDFPIGDATATVRHVAEQVGIPSSHVFDTVLDADEHDLPPQTWRRLQGTFPVDDWLLDDAHFVLDDAGLPSLQGTAEAELYVHLPASIRDADPGTVPVWLFGHGIFTSPQRT